MLGGRLDHAVTNSAAAETVQVGLNLPKYPDGFRL